MGKLTNLRSRMPVLKGRLAGSYKPYDRDKERRKAQPWRAMYNTAKWRALRIEVLKRDNWTCQRSGVVLSGKYPSPTSPVVDHIRPHRGDEKLFFDVNNLQAVSKKYHDSTKQRLEKGGRVKL